MRNFTLSILCILSCFSSFAIGPTVPASNIQFPASNLEGNRFTVTFNKGNGGFRIIVVKQGSAVATLPVNGIEYVANASYGTAAAEFAPGDGYVVYKGSNTSASVAFNVNGLQPGTTYHVAVFEYNGTGVNTEYLAIPLNGNVTTKSAPTVQAAITSFTTVAGNRMTVNFSSGNGEKRVLIARKGSPVNATPQNLVDYSPSPIFGSGTTLNTDNYVVYQGQGNSITVTGLEPNTVYHFAIFEQNGNLGPVYAVPGATGSQLTNAGPTQASGNINFTAEGNRLTLNFSVGNGKHQLIIARQGQAPTFVPTNGQTFTANTAFGSGQEVAAGEYVVNYTSQERTFTNLLPATTYFFRIYDFDIDNAGNTYYLTSTFSQNSSSTASAPTVQASNIRFESITGSSVTIKYDAGNSAYRLVVMKEGSPVDAIPADLTRYNGNAAFGMGNQVTPGNYVLNGGQNSTTVNVSNLTAGLTYHVAIFGFNGNNYPVYAVPAATASITIPNEPSAPASNWLTSILQGNGFRAQWTGGTGSKRLVIARKNAPVTATPTDGVNYTASAVFGNGAEIAAGQFVVHNDVNRLLDISGLEPATTYHFAVFEYNSAANNPDYLVSSFLTGTGTTVGTPTVQTSSLSATNIQDNQATINFAIGNGSSRIFIMRAGAHVDVTPQDLVSYTASSNFGAQEIGTGNYVVQKTNNSGAFTVLQLQPNTQYFISAFEFNGTSGPVYLSPAASFSFTTTGTGINAPTINASAAVLTAIDGNKFTFNWVNGNGSKRMVIARQGNAVTFTPVNGVEYTANTSFGSGTDIGNGQYVVFNGVTNNVAITNLLPATNYHFAVFEYNGSGATATYLLTGALTHNGSTAIAPATGSNNVAGTVANTTINITWTSGPGSGRLVVMKEGSAVTNQPVDLSKYPANAAFGTGSQTGTGEYVVYSGNGNNVTVTGLLAGKTYHYSVFEFNGIDAPVYNTTDAASNSATIPGSLPLTWLYFTATEVNNEVRLAWGTANEDNTSHFVIERSAGNGAFASIGTVQAANAGGNHDYQFVDAAQPSGTVSYRIKQVDIDNRFTYSKQVVIKAAAQKSVLSCYPNPAAGQTRISLPQGVQQATVQFYSAEGKLVLTRSVATGEIVSLHQLSKGIYYVVMEGEGNKYSTRLIVQ